jgi:hypothetical protein
VTILLVRMLPSFVTWVDVIIHMYSNHALAPFAIGK